MLKKIVEKLQKSPILYIFCYFFLDELFDALPPAALLQSAGMAFFYGLSGVSLFCRTRSAMEGASVVYRKNTVSFRKKLTGTKYQEGILFP